MFEGLRVAAGVIADEAITMARTGEDELECAVREHSRLVYRIAYSVLRNPQDAEDATQETFVRVLRYRRKLGGIKDQRAWLARIAWRVAVERNQKTPEVGLDEVSETISQLRSRAEAADESLLAGEMAEITAKLITTLPGELRDAITLSTVEEMAVADIAGVLGVTEAVVRSRIFRARQILREKLAALPGNL